MQQAILFEQEVCEAQAVLVYEMDEEMCCERFLARNGGSED